MGDIGNISAGRWTIRLKHFVKGDVHSVIAFISTFAHAAEGDRYILSNELGDGRVLSRAPGLDTQSSGYILFCPIESAYPRIEAQNLGSVSALHPETSDWYTDGKGLARVAGLDSLPQKIQTLLSMQQGENVFAPSAGVRFFEFLQEYSGSPWLKEILKLEVVRQAKYPVPGQHHRFALYAPPMCCSRPEFRVARGTPQGQSAPCARRSRCSRCRTLAA